MTMMNIVDKLVAARRVAELLKALDGLSLECQLDWLNPCWNSRPGDIAGKHWGGGQACSHCVARAAIAKARTDK
jgi:hypothetical protein